MTHRGFRNIDETEVYALWIRCKYVFLGMRRRQDGNIVAVLRERRGPVPPVPWLATPTRTALECGK
jgi:hypothetical protein